jgi:hypothetical protein
VKYKHWTHYVTDDGTTAWATSGTPYRNKFYKYRYYVLKTSDTGVDVINKKYRKCAVLPVAYENWDLDVSDAGDDGYGRI